MSFKLNKQFPTFLPAREECDCCFSLSMLSFIHPSMAKQTAYRILLVKRNSLLPIILYQWILTSFKCYSWVSLETDTLFKGDCANGHFHCFRKKEKSGVFNEVSDFIYTYIFCYMQSIQNVKWQWKRVWLFCFLYELTLQEISRLLISYCYSRSVSSTVFRLFI